MISIDLRTIPSHYQLLINLGKLTTTACELRNNYG